MKAAPTKTRSTSRPSAPLPLAVLTNPALEQIELALARQNRVLDVAFASVAALGDVSFVVSPELLEGIDTACFSQSTARGTLLTLKRC